TSSAVDGGQLLDTNDDGRIDRIVLTITDNGIGDFDPKVGVIVDPVFLATPNTPPTILGVPTAVQDVTTTVPAALSDFTVADAEQGATSLSVTLSPKNGAILGLTDADSKLAGIQLVGTAQAINAALAGATFSASVPGAASIEISVSDGEMATPVTASYKLLATAADPDTDGIDSSQEDAIAGLSTTAGAAALQGDGNADGVRDSQQAHVTSSAFLKTPTAQSQPGNATPTFITLVADSKDGKTDTSDNNTASLSNVKQLDAPANLPSSLKMPLGLISFSANVGISGTSSGGITETFSLYVDSSLGVNGYWKQDSAGFWTNLAGQAFGGQVVQEGDKTRLDFKLTDGGAFDADHAVNGVIVDPGAAGFMPLSMVGYVQDPWISLVGYAPELPPSGYWF
ncbi:MAG: hypothetical protein K9K38_13290, partial [Rhodoferax sp.]|nr:hypothetical protein [Rhodoferax sp.]